MLSISVGVRARRDQVAVVCVSRRPRRRGWRSRRRRRAWATDGPPERLRVGGVGEQCQVGERVADLGALVEPEAAEHPVRDPGPGERGLQRPGRVPGPREHEHLAGGDAACERLGDRGRDTVRLVAV